MDIKALIKNISMIVGIAVVAVFGLFFILFGDLFLGATSGVLFLGIFFPLASIVFFVLSESFKHKQIMFYVFKGLAIALAIGFVVYVFYFMSTAASYADSKVYKAYGKYISENPGKGKDDYIGIIKGVCVTIGVFGIIGVLAQGANVVMNKLIGLD